MLIQFKAQNIKRVQILLNENSDTEDSDNASEGEYCESSTSEEESQDDQKCGSAAVDSAASKSPYEMLREKNIARNSKELSRIFGLPELKTGLQLTKTNNISKKKKKKNSVQEDDNGVDFSDVSSDLDLHYRDLTVNELSIIDNRIKENVGKLFIE
jgi:hypothetical protein